MTRITDSFKKLYQSVQAQDGFFTTRQAMDAGYSAKNHAYHVNRGTWVREERGIYRLAQFPEPEDSDLILWALWSRDRKGRVQGVYSYQTALRIHGLTDLNPAKLHMTIPPQFRRSAPTPKILALHRDVIESRDIERRKGFGVTTVRRTLEDLAREGRVTDEVIRQGVEEGVRQGVLKVRDVAETPLLAKMKSLARKVADGRRWL
jgi:predicted transcriptional regulator of viral defense system